MRYVYDIQKNEVNLIAQSVKKLEMFYQNNEAKEFIDIVTQPRPHPGTSDWYKQQVIHSALHTLGYTFYVNPYYDTKSLFNLASFLGAIRTKRIEYCIKENCYNGYSIVAPQYDTPAKDIKTDLKSLLTLAEKYAKTQYNNNHSKGGNFECIKCSDERERK